PAGCAWCGGSPSVRRLERIEPRLGTGDVVAGVRKAVAVDLRAAARLVDMRDAVRAEQNEVAVANLVLVAVEPAYRRAGRSVSLLVVRAAVARADESSRRSIGMIVTSSPLAVVSVF